MYRAILKSSILHWSYTTLYKYVLLKTIYNSLRRKSPLPAHLLFERPLGAVVRVGEQHGDLHGPDAAGNGGEPGSDLTCRRVLHVPHHALAGLLALICTQYTNTSPTRRWPDFLLWSVHNTQTHHQPGAGRTSYSDLHTTHKHITHQALAGLLTLIYTHHTNTSPTRRWPDFLLSSTHNTQTHHPPGAGRTSYSHLHTTHTHITHQALAGLLTLIHTQHTNTSPTRRWPDFLLSSTHNTQTYHPPGAGRTSYSHLHTTHKHITHQALARLLTLTYTQHTNTSPTRRWPDFLLSSTHNTQTHHPPGDRRTSYSDLYTTHKHITHQALAGLLTLIYTQHTNTSPTRRWPDFLLWSTHNTQTHHPPGAGRTSYSDLYTIHKHITHQVLAGLLTLICTQYTNTSPTRRWPDFLLSSTQNTQTHHPPGAGRTSYSDLHTTHKHITHQALAGILTLIYTQHTNTSPTRRWPDFLLSSTHNTQTHHTPGVGRTSCSDLHTTHKHITHQALAGLLTLICTQYTNTSPTRCWPDFLLWSVHNTQTHHPPGAGRTSYSHLHRIHKHITHQALAGLLTLIYTQHTNTSPTRRWPDFLLSSTHNTQTHHPPGAGRTSYSDLHTTHKHITHQALAGLLTPIYTQHANTSPTRRWPDFLLSSVHNTQTHHPPGAGRTSYSHLHTTHKHITHQALAGLLALIYTQHTNTSPTRRWQDFLLSSTHNTQTHHPPGAGRTSYSHLHTTRKHITHQALAGLLTLICTQHTNTSPARRWPDFLLSSTHNTQTHHTPGVGRTSCSDLHTTHKHITHQALAGLLTLIYTQHTNTSPTRRWPDFLLWSTHNTQTHHPPGAGRTSYSHLHTTHKHITHQALAGLLTLICTQHTNTSPTRRWPDFLLWSTHNTQTHHPPGAGRTSYSHLHTTHKHITHQALAGLLTLICTQHTNTSPARRWPDFLLSSTHNTQTHHPPGAGRTSYSHLHTTHNTQTHHPLGAGRTSYSDLYTTHKHITHQALAGLLTLIYTQHTTHKHITHQALAGLLTLICTLIAYGSTQTCHAWSDWKLHANCLN